MRWPEESSIDSHVRIYLGYNKRKRGKIVKNDVIFTLPDDLAAEFPQFLSHTFN